MTTDSEKRLLKEFLDVLDTNKLCEIARSVYHGGGVSAHTREGNAIIMYQFRFDFLVIDI